MSTHGSDAGLSTRSLTNRMIRERDANVWDY